MTEVPAPFGKYYLTEKLAAGGMAEIYLGKLVGPGGFEKLLVIKQIHPRFGGMRHFVDLFVAEAKTLVGLVHGNIVPVYELGVIGDTYYIAMEYIDGPSLYRLTEQLRAAGAPMAPALAAHITTKILDGLDYAHRKGDGVIHRDLSGRNVMVSRDGDVKLVDFGIAVSLGDAGDHAGELPAGSFPYMSPEQVRREPLTGQSDLFSAGILLWEMLTGERLFARADAAATMRAVTDAEIPRPSLRNPAVPGRLDDVVMKALHRDPLQRWHTAAEMLAALHRYLYSLATTPGARDLSQLVSRYCPPSVRRHHTDADFTPDRAAAGELSSAEGLEGSARGELTAGSAAGGNAVPSTAVMQRTPGSQPMRQQSFATHVELVGLLGPGAAGDGSDSVADNDAADDDDAKDPDRHLAAQVTSVHVPEPSRSAPEAAAEPEAEPKADGAHAGSQSAAPALATTSPPQARTRSQPPAPAGTPPGQPGQPGQVTPPRPAAPVAPSTTLAAPQSRSSRRRAALLVAVGALVAGAAAIFLAIRPWSTQPDASLADAANSSDATSDTTIDGGGRVSDTALDPPLAAPDARDARDAPDAQGAARPTPRDAPRAPADDASRRGPVDAPTPPRRAGTEGTVWSPRDRMRRPTPSPRTTRPRRRRRRSSALAPIRGARSFSMASPRAGRRRPCKFRLADTRSRSCSRWPIHRGVRPIG
ncbi:MAG: protein kinase [Myxococcales bacterium]|nr:protein kinase [Myxococcales bacterium]